ncbi:MAG: hypothetical protein ABIP75_03220 [Pyrinomonadaceae bacterium]
MATAETIKQTLAFLIENTVPVGDTLTAERIRTFAEAWEDTPDDVLQSAARRYVVEAKFFPKPYEFQQVLNRQLLQVPVPTELRLTAVQRDRWVELVEDGMDEAAAMKAVANFTSEELCTCGDPYVIHLDQDTGTHIFGECHQRFNLTGDRDPDGPKTCLCVRFEPAAVAKRRVA